MPYSTPAVRQEKHIPSLPPPPHRFSRQENYLTPYDGIYSLNTTWIAPRCVWDTMQPLALSEHYRACGTRQALHIEPAIMMSFWMVLRKSCLQALRIYGYECCRASNHKAPRAGLSGFSENGRNHVGPFYAGNSGVTTKRTNRVLSWTSACVGLGKVTWMPRECHNPRICLVLRQRSKCCPRNCYENGHHCPSFYEKPHRHSPWWKDSGRVIEVARDMTRGF